MGLSYATLACNGQHVHTDTKRNIEYWILNGQLIAVECGADDLPINIRKAHVSESQRKISS
jgi:hypothetical protein